MLEKLLGGNKIVSRLNEPLKNTVHLFLQTYVIVKTQFPLIPTAFICR